MAERPMKRRRGSSPSRGRASGAGAQEVGQDASRHEVIAGGTRSRATIILPAAFAKDPPLLCLPNASKLYLEAVRHLAQTPNSEFGFADLVGAVVSALRANGHALRRGQPASSESPEERAWVEQITEAFESEKGLRLLVGGSQLTRDNMSALVNVVHQARVDVVADQSVERTIRALAGWSTSASAVAPGKGSNPFGTSLTLWLTNPDDEGRRPVPWRPNLKFSPQQHQVIPGFAPGFKASATAVHFDPTLHTQADVTCIPYNEINIEEFKSEGYLWFTEEIDWALELEFDNLNQDTGRQLKRYSERGEWAICNCGVGVAKKLVLRFVRINEQKYQAQGFFMDRDPRQRFEDWLDQSQNVVDGSGLRKLMVVLDIDDTLLRKLGGAEAQEPRRLEIEREIGERFAVLDMKKSGTAYAVLADGAVDKLRELESTCLFYIVTAGSREWASAVRDMFNQRLGRNTIRQAHSIRPTGYGDEGAKKYLQQFFPLRDFRQANERFVIFDDRRDAWCEHDKVLVAVVKHSMTTLNLQSRYEWLHQQLANSNIELPQFNPLTQSREDQLKGNNILFDQFVENNLKDFRALSEMLSLICHDHSPRLNPVPGERTRADFVKRWDELGKSGDFQEKGKSLLFRFHELDLEGLHGMYFYERILQVLQNMARTVGRLGEWQEPSFADWTSNLSSQLDILKRIQVAVSRGSTVQHALQTIQDDQLPRPESPPASPRE